MDRQYKVKGKLQEHVNAEQTNKQTNGDDKE
jgi:hypothetical protein